MKVLLVGNYAPDDQASMQAFRAVLERQLPLLGCQVRSISPPEVLARHVSRSHRLWKWLGYVDKFVLFPRRLAAAVRWADVVHICDHSNGMYVPTVLARPNVITCHDVIAIQAALGIVRDWEVGWTGRLFQRLISSGLARADRIACVSDLTCRELLKLGLADPNKLLTICNGLNAPFEPPSSEQARILLQEFGISAQDSYLLHVGQDHPRKNRDVVLRTFAALRAAGPGSGAPALRKLVLVGPALSGPMRAYAEQQGFAHDVLTLQNVSHPQLCALYSCAFALLFPSLLEGFGWPVIEAQACGCPVFTSDLAPMNEIGGSGAVYVNPNDSEAIATQITEWSARLGDLRQEGLRNAARFSSGRMVAQYLAAYQDVIQTRQTAA